MSYRAIYAYAWDLMDHGLTEAVEDFRALGLDTVTVAGSYHAGKFLRPWGRDEKVYFPLDGTVYFNPDPSYYGAIKPITSPYSDFDAVAHLCKSKDIKTNVWLVLLHNTAIGTKHPLASVENAFTDSYPYSLCPSAPEAREYAIALCRDVTDHNPVMGISLETPGFLPYAHGFHHEFALNRPNRWLDNLLGLCFCQHCCSGAKAAGLKVGGIGGLKDQVRDMIDGYLSSDVNYPADMAEAFWLADVFSNGELRAYLQYRCDKVTSLVAEIRAKVRKDATVAVIPSVARPTAGAWYEGSDLRALSKVTNIIEACFYENGAARVRADLFDVRKRLEPGTSLRGILRPAYPDFESKAEFLAAVQGLIDGGVRDLAFYNWGHLRAANMAWIEDAMRMLKEG